MCDALRSRIEHDFTYHPPKGIQIPRFERLRAGGKDLAMLIAELCPGSPEQTLAIRKVEEAIFWANAGIARNEAERVPPVPAPDDH